MRWCATNIIRCAVDVLCDTYMFRVNFAHVLPIFTFRLDADSHMDATTQAFADAFGEEARRPEWVVSSPPYKHAFAILKRALTIGRVGVAFKLRLTFHEPTKSRGQWLKDNPPHSIVVLPRAMYRGRKCSSTEAWFIWKGGREDECKRPAFFFSLPT